MRYKIVKTKKEKSPLIIPLMYYMFGVVMLLIMLSSFILFPPKEISDFIGIFGITIIFGGLAVLSIVVGYRRR